MSQTTGSMSAFGGSLVGSWLALGLYGTTTTQAYIYWVNYPKDDLWKKALVTFLWILNTAHSICLCHFIYYHLITATSDPSLQFQNGWSLNAVVLLHVPVIATVMMFYTRMIFVLCSERSRCWLTGCVAITVMFNFGFGLDLAIRTFMSSSILGLHDFTADTVLPSYVLQLVADVSITGSLCVILYKQKTEFRRTRKLLNTLIVYAASRGLLTLVAVFIIVLALVIGPNQSWFPAVEFMMPGLYTNALMVVFNGRPASLEVEECSPETLLAQWSPASNLPTINFGNAASVSNLESNRGCNS